ncbi:hypothetical protein [Candidatus Nitrotoga sp. M5]|uniref:hypothetical protein n=1 Tax=Candidatus Nitrotoga sp. M5 TaxID=2890409 RepID=UPI001EF205C1|nr:hypothetical protein [Candidatus Nitrotoga sp. M5]CAH1386829.1 hypothetical protein NTGM5_350008 [Candidatus Nitrotoga sp. M5]
MLNQKIRGELQLYAVVTLKVSVSFLILGQQLTIGWHAAALAARVEAICYIQGRSLDSDDGTVSANESVAR